MTHIEAFFESPKRMWVRAPAKFYAGSKPLPD